jgi:hypothetical protein
LVFPAAEQGKTSRAIPKGLALLLLPLAFGFSFPCCGAGENQGLLQSSRKTSRAIPRLCYCCLWPLVFPAAEQGKTSRAIPKGLALLLLPLQQPLVFPAQGKTSRAIPKGLALLPKGLWF